MSLLPLKLLALRKQHLTQVELATYLGLDRSHISRIESQDYSQRYTPSLLVCVKIARLFDISTDWLLRETIPATPLPKSRVIELPEFEGTFTIDYIGAKIRYQRQRHDWSLADLRDALQNQAVSVSVTTSMLNHLEVGRRLPSITLVTALADLFQLPLDYFLDDRMPIEIPPPQPEQGDEIQSKARK